MLLFIISLFTATIANTSTTSSRNVANEFYDQVLSDYRRQSLFVACEISSSRYSGKVVIENADLYAYFKQQRGLSKRKYKKYMLQKLSSGDKIEIKSEDLSRWKFLKVEETTIVKQQVSVGTESFIRSFFNDRVIKEDVNFQERNAIIYQLFSWQIGSKIDDETGYLYIPVLPEASDQ